VVLPPFKCNSSKTLADAIYYKSSLTSLALRPRADHVPSSEISKKCSDVPDLPRAFTKPGSILEEATGVNSPPFLSASGESASASTASTLDSTPTWA
jgi:hypothetical protein